MDPARKYTLELLIALGAVPLLLAILLTVGRVLNKRIGMPLGVRFRLMCAGFSAWVPLCVYQEIVQAQFRALAKGPTDVTVDGANAPMQPFLFPEPLLQALLALTIFCGSLVAVKLMRKYFWDGWFERRNLDEAPKFLSDIASAAIVGIALVTIASGVYHKDLSALQLGSTVSVAVLGFASQDLLGNLLSGIALQIGSPFKKGDWLLVEGKRLQVREVNWRSTRMRSGDNVQVEVPNKSIANSTIINLSAPTAERATTITVGFEYSAEPETAKACLERAACSCEDVLKTPPPRAFLKDFGDSAVHYELSFWADSEEHLLTVTDAVRTRIWHEAKATGLNMPYPMRVIQIDGDASALPPSPVKKGA